ncbi:hypothetical protein [Thermus thermophilus]|uniref:hypothetical protein n=1 Tax=Thermus thermophilus TaxID=274 RepID=UPI001CC6EE70|nr:hypothetical protein [Thermus thermophilus]
MNLDIRCAELGRQLASVRDQRGKPIEEKVLNAALAVLEEQGPYAMFLYLKARQEKVAGPMAEKSLAFLKDVFAKELQETRDILEAVKKLSEDLDKLLFARDLLRTALAYARYHVKARDEGAA